MSWYRISPAGVGVTVGRVDSDSSGLPDEGQAVTAASLAAAGAAGSATVSGALDEFFAARAHVLPGLSSFVDEATRAARRATSDYVEGDDTMGAETSDSAHGLGLN